MGSARRPTWTPSATGMPSRKGPKSSSMATASLTSGRRGTSPGTTTARGRTSLFVSMREAPRGARKRERAGNLRRVGRRWIRRHRFGWLRGQRRRQRRLVHRVGPLGTDLGDAGDGRVCHQAPQFIDSADDVLANHRLELTDDVRVVAVRQVGRPVPGRALDEPARLAALLIQLDLDEPGVLDHGSSRLWRSGHGG
jgi:hypothetical protein